MKTASHPASPLRHFFRRHIAPLALALSASVLVTGCSVVAVGLAAPALALTIPLFALQLIAADIERFFNEASVLQVGAAVETAFGRIVVPVPGFVSRPTGTVPGAVTLVSGSGNDPQASNRFNGRFDACSFPTPAGADRPRAALYRQADLSGQAHIVRQSRLVSGAEVQWRGMTAWSFEAVLPVGLDGQPSWCRGMLAQRGGTSYFFARSVPLRTAAARALDANSPEAQQARREFREFAGNLSLREGAFNASASATRIGGTGALDLP